MSALPPGDGDPWTVRGVRRIYDNPWIRLEEHDARHASGRESLYGVVRMKKRAVGAIPLFHDGRVRLVGQWRFPLARYSWEIPEGGSDDGESLEAAARRELAEETGLTATTLIPLARTDLSNSVTDESSLVYLAFGLTEGTAQPDDVETLQTHDMRFGDAVEAIAQARIRDSLTQIALLMAESMARRGDLPRPIIDALARGGAAL